MRDAAILDRAAQLMQVGDVARDAVESAELVVVEQQPQPVVTAAEVVGRHAAALVEQQPHRPGTDAAIRAGHQEVLLAVHRFNGIARPRSAASAASAAR